MTNSTAFYVTIVSQVTQFINDYEELLLLADRISADSSSATNLATAAQAGGRSDLTAANFNNFNLAMAQLQALFDNTNANVPNGGTLRLTFYQLM